jgi:hypothetical protein
MKTILLITWLAASVVSSARAEQKVLTEAEAQQLFDTAVANADNATITHIWFPWYLPPKEPVRKRILREISSQEEIRLLSKYIKLRIPPPTKKVVDGREVLIPSEGFHTDCTGIYLFELKRNGTGILSFDILSENIIGCAAIRNDSGIWVDAASLHPYYEELTKILKEAEANQALLPTPMSVTDRAGARSAPDTGAADL